MFIATCPPGIEDLLQRELSALGASQSSRAPGAVHFDAPFDVALKALLWARLPNRILWILARYPATDRAALFAGARALPWSQWLSPDKTLGVHCARGEGALDHTHFVALVVKDAIVDALRDATGRRPSIDPKSPDARVHVHIRRGEALIAYDLSGDSLHRRGYRLGGGDAPLKENVAAAVLWRSGWPEAARAGRPLIDPMCGSGTLVIEAALMATGCPANAGRQRFGVDGLLPAHAPGWAALQAQAEQARAQALAAPLDVKLYGYDISDAQLSTAQAQARRAGVAPLIHFERRDVADLRPPPGATAGEIVTNPPFGARLGGSESAVRALMGTLGQALGRMPGFLAHVLVADEEMGFALGLRAPRSHRIMHGPLACTLLHIDCDPTQGALGARPTGGAVEALKNRLRKNLKGLTPYLQEHGIGSFRLYDSDLPEYAVAIDVYTAVGGAKHAHIQEYAAPQEVPPKVAQARLRQVLEAVGDIMELGPSDMALKVRRRQKPEDQYGAREARRLPTLRGPRAPSPEAQGFWVRENGLLFYVDLHRYVDTGLFLDHRRVRAWMLKHARGKHMLNLFGYTGSVSVAAAAGGALSTTTLDLSATYLSWAEQNLRQNALLEPRQRLVQADCLTWVRQNPKPTYDIAFVNPPTFSNSKRMMEAFDVVRDHGMLLDATMAWVKKDGVALFTTHARRLRIDERLAQSYAITEISRSVRPKDFDRAKVGCRAWLIRHLGGA